MGIHSDAKRVTEHYRSPAFQVPFGLRIKDENIRDNFFQWLNHIELCFRQDPQNESPTAIEYTISRDIYTEYLHEKDWALEGLLLHHYLHYLIKLMFSRIGVSGETFAREEIVFMEDMYINAWMNQIDSEITKAFQEVILGDRIIHNVSFNKTEDIYNSLLTPDLIESNMLLTSLYQEIYSNKYDFLNRDSLSNFITTWQTILEDGEAKDIIQNIDITYEKAKKKEEAK